MSESDEGFLARWSRRKIKARNAPVVADASLPAVAPSSTAPNPAEGEGICAPPPPVQAEGAPAPLPPPESLTPDSDFAPFMRPGVDPTLKGQALKALFADAALYPMDGLDVYIDDYTKPDPLPAGWLEKLNQLAMLNGEPAAKAPEDRETAGTGDASCAPSASAQPAADTQGFDTSAAPAAEPDSMSRGAI